MNKYIPNGNLELILSIEDEGIAISIFKKLQNNALVKLDYEMDDSFGFKLLQKTIKDLEGFGEGCLLYTGDKNINQISTMLASLGFVVGIEPFKEKTIEEKIIFLTKKMNQAADDEDYMKAAEYRDEIKSLSK